jgi:hypothetical protein
MRRSLIVNTHASSCYFRTSVGGDGRKALIQITERCNLHCAHCFVSSGDWGDLDRPADDGGAAGIAHSAAPSRAVHAAARQRRDPRQ